MNINKSILAAALGLASVSMADATQYIYYTGSTAARDAIYNTLIAGVGFDAAPSFVGYGSTTPGSCSYMIFSNTISGTPTIVKCAWSGSEAGITDVTGTTPELFLSNPGQNGVATSGASSGAVTGLTNDISQVDIAQADNALSFSETPSSNAKVINDNLVIPFVLVKNPTTLTDQNLITNITADNFKNLANGGAKMALFTGNAADTGHYVYLAGRDEFSGTRVNTFGDTGWGIKKSPSQIVLSGGVMQDPLAEGTYETYEGQSSGGTLAKSLVDTTSSADNVNGGTGFIAVAYLGLADEATGLGLTPPVVPLNYDGVPYTTANVENGTYTLWGYEFTLYRNGDSSTVQTFATAVAAGLPSYTVGYEIPVSQMQATRTGPTANPTHK